MKTIKQILEHYNPDLLNEIGLSDYQSTMSLGKSTMNLSDYMAKDHLSKLDKRSSAKFPPETQVPVIIVLKRKAIRVFPDNQKIALYYSQMLDKYVSIPFGPNNKAAGIHISEARKIEYDDEVEEPLRKDVESEYKNKKIDRRKALRALPTHIATQHKGGTKEQIKKYIEDPNLGLAATSGRVVGTLLSAYLNRKKRRANAEQAQSRKNRPTQSSAPEKDETVYFKGKPIGKKSELKDVLKKGKVMKVKPKKRGGPTLNEGAGGTLLGWAGKALNKWKAGRAAKQAGKDAGVMGSKEAMEQGVKGKGLGKGKPKGKPKPKKGKNAEGGAKGRLATAMTSGAIGGAALMGALGGESWGGAAKRIGAEKAGNIVRRDFTAAPSLADTVTFHRGQAARNIMDPQEKLYMKRMYGEETNNFDKIKQIVENNIKSEEIQFGDKSVTINNRIAKKLVNLHESLSKENKKKIEQMLNEDVNSFKKIINFAIRQ